MTDTTDRSNMFYWQVDRPFDAKQTKDIFLDRYSLFSIDDAQAAIEYGMKKAGFSSEDMQVATISPPEKVLSSVNIIYFATLKSGREVTIRIHPPGVKNGYFWVEKVATSTARTLGIPTYETYLIDDTREKFPFDYMITERLPGKTMQLYWPLKSDLEKILIEETGEFLAKIHSIKIQKYGFFDNKIAKEKDQLIGIHTSWKAHIFAAYEANLKFLIDNNVITTDDRKTIETIFSKHESDISCSSPSMIHNDLADWNQLSDGVHVTGILDWDECYSGDPVADFSAWSVFFPYSRMQHLINGYNRVSQLPDGYEEKLHLYRLRYIISKSVSRKMKTMITPNETYQNMLVYALKILHEEFSWFGF